MIRFLVKYNLFPKPSSNVEYPECDGIRGVAILLVFWVHCSSLLKFRYIEYPYWNIFYIITYSGFYGVQLFFVLSAYLLFLSQYIRILNGNPPQQISHFVIRRFFRIAPIYYLSTLALVCLVNICLPNADKLKHTLFHLFFIHIFNPEIAYSINSVTWSLGVEFMFYLSLPFILLLTSHLYRSKNTAVTKLTTPLLIVLLIFSILAISFNTSSLLTTSSASFCYGILAAIISYNIAQKKLIDKRLLTLAGIVSLAGVFSIHYYLYFIGQTSDELYNKTLIHGIPLISFFYTIALLASTQKDYFLYPILSFIPLRIIGLFSYEIYIIHLFVIDHWTTKSPLYFKMEHYSPFINGTIILFVTVLIAAMLHAFISRPFIRISSFLIKRKPEQPIPSWMSLMLFSFFIVTISAILHLVMA